MKSIKNTVFFILIISGLIFAKKADYMKKANYAKVIHSDIYSTIIDFEMDDFDDRYLNVWLILLYSSLHIG